MAVLSTDVISLLKSMASKDPGFKYILYLHLPVYKEVTSSCGRHWIFKCGDGNIEVNDKHST